MSLLALVFSAYGFTTPEQHLDMVRLLHLAGCFEERKLNEDLRETGHSDSEIKRAIDISAKTTHDEFNPTAILSIFEQTETRIHTHSLEKTLNWLIRVTQREFFARKSDQERWQQETGKWIIDNEKVVREIAIRLKLTSEVAPKKQYYNAIAIFGSTAPEMEKRLNYTRQLLQERKISADRLYLLCGERPADSAVDSEEYLQSVVKNQEIDRKQITETHLMIAAYRKVFEVSGEQFRTITQIVTDTPRGTKPRPDTIDTLNALSKKLNNERSMLFISSAPNIKAQEEATKTVLSAMPIVTEVAGDACPNTITLSRIMTALGGSLYGGYARVAIELGSHKTTKELNEILQTLGFRAAMPHTATATSTTVVYLPSAGPTSNRNVQGIAGTVLNLAVEPLNASVRRNPST